MKRTPLYEEHLRLGAKMVEYGGWEMPLNYPTGIIAEHLTTRKFGGLFDISHMGRFLIGGEAALPFMQYVLTNNAAAIAPGESQYTIIANEGGGAVDDTYLYRIGETKYLLVVNANNIAKDWDWLNEHRSGFPGLILEDHSAKTAMLSLQGPRAKALLEKIVGGVEKLPEPVRNRLATVELLGCEIPVARTGYTGEPIGFELFPPAEMAEALHRKLLEVGQELGIVPAGLGARDTLRLEAGLPLYGHELGRDSEGTEIPIFALSQAKVAVSFSDLKGSFIGREELWEQFQEVKLREEGQLDLPKEKRLVPQIVVPMVVSGGVPRVGCPVYVGKTRVGNVTSGTVVPYWQTIGSGALATIGDEPHRRAICLAYVDADLKEGQEVTVVIRDKTVRAIIVEREIGGEAAPYARPLLVEEVEVPLPTRPKKTIQNLSRNLVRKACANTLWRQTDAINLIPSEQTESPLVRLLTIADPMGRYAEHRKVEALGDAETYYYQGTDFIAEVELELAAGLREYFGCSEVEARVISGQMANTTVFSALVDYLNRLDRKVEPRRLKAELAYSYGKVVAIHAIGDLAVTNCLVIDPVTEKWAVVNFPIALDNPYRIDLERTAELIEEHRPELIILGRSLILHREPVRELAEIISSIRPKPILMYDAAHVIGLLGPYFQEPLKDGADIITGSTHKTFFGTQRGVVASNMSEGTDYYDLWQTIQRRAFPGSVSNHHLGTLLGLLMATYEMNTYGRDYQKQVIANAKAFARALRDLGVNVEGDPSIDNTETHQVVLRVGYARGIEVADRLEKNNIIVNYQALPDDEAFTASSGLRTGVQEMTRAGMKEADFGELAEYLAAVILREEDVARKVAQFRKRFVKMHYCLPEEQSEPMVRELVASLMIV